MYDTPRINKKENVPYRKVFIFTPMCVFVCNRLFLFPGTTLKAHQQLSG